MIASRACVIGLGLLCACAKPSDIEPSAAGSSSTAGSSSESGAPASTSVVDESTSGTLGSTSGIADSEGTGSGSSTGGPMSGVVATGSFTIPAGATVEEFSFTSTLEFTPGVLDGSVMVVAVTDVSHPRRNQDELCTTSHPLDGCATVDYGAFGETYDNRVTFEGVDGPIVAHLWKDRGLMPDTEALLDTE